MKQYSYLTLFLFFSIVCFNSLANDPKPTNTKPEKDGIKEDDSDTQLKTKSLTDIIEEKKALEKKSDQSTEKSDVTYGNVGKLKLIVKDINGKEFETYFMVYPKGNQVESLGANSSSKSPVPLPAGVYNVKLWHFDPPATWVKGVVIRKGEVTELNVLRTKVTRTIADVLNE